MSPTSPNIGDLLRSTVDLVLGLGSDIFVLLGAAIIVMAFSFYFGRDRLVALVAGLFVAIPLYIYFPFPTFLGSNPYLHIGLYVVCALIGTVVFSGLSSFVPSMGGGVIKTGLLSVIIAAFLLSVGLTILPLRDVYAFSAPTLQIFSASTFFYWMYVPLFGIFFLGR